MTSAVAEAKALFVASIKGYIARQIDGVAARLDAHEKRLLDAPAPINGRDGVDGKDGRDGVAGADGKSIDMREVEAMVRAAVDAIPPAADGKDGIDGKDGRDGEQGQAGEKGEKGQVGQDGTRGDDGASGADGKPGADGANGDPGEPGAKGIDGTNGRDGVDGEPGRDALQLEILPAIDFARCYPRGTYAMHKGGLWRTFEKTAAERGWECIVVGVAGVELEQDEQDFRKSVFRVVLSDGVKEFRPANHTPRLRDDYKAGESCEKADLVVFGGSLWMATKDTSETPGSNTTDWKIAARKGRDGKDGLPGEPGRAGKDLMPLGANGARP